MGQLVKNTSITSKEGTAASVILPGGTTAERPSTPITALLRYNETTNQVEYYNGTEWKFAAVAGIAPVTRDTLGPGDAIVTTFTMSKTVVDERDVHVTVGGLFQNPEVDYTVDGSTTLTFVGGAPPDTQSIVVIHGYNEIP